MEGKRGKGPEGPGFFVATQALPTPYLQGPLQGLVVRSQLVHPVLVGGTPLDERLHGVYLQPQLQPLFLQPLRCRRKG